MRRFVTWAAGIVGLAALVRLLRGRRGRAADADAGVEAADPAAALRGKLAESREDPPVTSAEESATAEEEPAAGGATLDERRARVHEQARQAIDEMGGGDG